MPVASEFEFGVFALAGRPTLARAAAEQADKLGYEGLWTGDHLSFPMPILDPLLQLAQLATYTERARLATGVYLLPLRHPVPVAKQVGTLDHLTEGRLIFGVGVGGEFPLEYEAAGVPLRERGARLTESIEVLKLLWTGEEVSYDGRFFQFDKLRMRPAPRQSGGPPIWCGGRSAAALQRMGRMADGWLSYVVTPEAFREGLETIASAAAGVGRQLDSFGTGHLLFSWIDESYEKAFEQANAHLSQRYGMDFSRATRKYAALGRPEDVAERVAAYRAAGVRHIVLDLTGPSTERDAQIEAFAHEVRPLLS